MLERKKEGGTRDRERSTWAQMLTFCCTGVCILLLGGIVAYVNLEGVNQGRGSLLLDRKSNE